LLKLKQRPGMSHIAATKWNAVYTYPAFADDLNKHGDDRRSL